MVSISKIKQLITLLREHNLYEIEVQFSENNKIRISDHCHQPSPVTASPSVANPTTAVGTTKPPAGHTILAPMVGTLYLSEAPEKPTFVKVGSTVKKGDTLCIIEAMKMFNKLTADRDGEIKAILAENASSVEYQQPLFILSE